MYRRYSTSHRSRGSRTQHLFCSGDTGEGAEDGADDGIDDSDDGAAGGASGTNESAGGSASDWALGRGNLAGPHTRIRMKPAGPGDTAGRELGVRAVARSAAATAGSAAVPQNCPNRGSVQ